MLVLVHAVGLAVYGLVPGRGFWYLYAVPLLGTVVADVLAHPLPWIGNWPGLRFGGPQMHAAGNVPLLLGHRGSSCCNLTFLSVICSSAQLTSRRCSKSTGLYMSVESAITWLYICASRVMAPSAAAISAPGHFFIRGQWL